MTDKGDTSRRRSGTEKMSALLFHRFCRLFCHTIAESGCRDNLQTLYRCNRVYLHLRKYRDSSMRFHRSSPNGCSRRNMWMFQNMLLGSLDLLIHPMYRGNKLIRLRGVPVMKCAKGRTYWYFLPCNHKSDLLPSSPTLPGSSLALA